MEETIAKTSWSQKEKDGLKEKYGCEILVERAKKEQLDSSKFPNESVPLWVPG